MMPLFGPPNIEKLQANRDIPGLIKALSYPKDAHIRQHAAQALGDIGDTHAVEPLIAALKASEIDVRKNAAEALGKISDARAMEELFAALQDLVVGVRQAAARALGMIGNARAVEPLIIALLDLDTGVRKSAAGALDNIGWQPGQDESSASYWIAKQEVEKCIDIGAPAVESLIHALKDRYPDVQANAAEALGQIGDPRAVKPLLVALKDVEEYVCAQSALALGKIGDASAIKPLMAVLKDGDWQVCRASADALVMIGSSAVEPLIAELADIDAYGHNIDDIYFYNVIEALGKIGDLRAVEPLIALLNDHLDHYYKIPCTTIKALGEIGDLRAVEPLIRALKIGDFTVREASAEALGKIGDLRAIEPFISALNDPYVGVRRAAATALVAMVKEQKLDPLTRKAILDLRCTIEKPHSDYPAHGCSEHSDNHGIGIDFPL